MVTFIICLAALVAAYFIYGKLLCRVVGINDNNPMPSKTHYDGVDYIPLPRWRIFVSTQFVGMGACTEAYIYGGAVTAVLSGLLMLNIRRDVKRGADI